MRLQKVEELIKNGSNVNSKDNNGESPLRLHVASALGEAPILLSLIKNGADVDILDNLGRTPLHRAVSEGHAEVVQLLIDNHANISIVSNGESATDIALKRLTETETSSSNYSNVKNIYNELQRARTSWKTCKAYNFERSNRILGGEAVVEREYPWMAALGYLSTDYRVTFGCGGTVISENFILTAAHCARTQQPPVVCRLGTLKLIDDDGVNDTHRPTNLAIKQIIRHPLYSHFSRKNDIALILVTPTIQFSNNISPACLHTDLRNEHPDVKLIVTGWGSTTADGAESHRSNDLLKAQLITVPLAECNEKFKEYQSLANDPTLQNIGQSQYCAYDPDGKNDSCQGDSGGPLHLKSPYEASPTIVGIVSVGLGCGALPGIYTRIAYYLDWIEPIVWPNGFIPKVSNN